MSVAANNVLLICTVLAPRWICAMRGASPAASARKRVAGSVEVSTPRR